MVNLKDEVNQMVKTKRRNWKYIILGVVCCVVAILNIYFVPLKEMPIGYVLLPIGIVWIYVGLKRK